MHRDAQDIVPCPEERDCPKSSICGCHSNRLLDSFGETVRALSLSWYQWSNSLKKTLNFCWRADVISMFPGVFVVFPVHTILPHH